MSPWGRVIIQAPTVNAILLLAAAAAASQGRVIFFLPSYVTGHVKQANLTATGVGNGTSGRRQDGSKHSDTMHK